MKNVFGSHGSIKNVAILAVFSLCSVLATGCNGKNNLIQKVTVAPSDSLDVLRLTLVFNNSITSAFLGIFDLKNYGNIFISPHSDTQPFEIGFELNTSIVNDQDFAKFTATTVLPNGASTGVPYALVQVQAATPINKAFDLFGYVDVLHKAWLGAAAIFTFMNDKTFPADLSLSQVFLRDAMGNPGVIASVFGPKNNPDGTLLRNGGVAVFANVKQLLTQTLDQPKAPFDLLPEPAVYMDGSAAAIKKGNALGMGKLRKSFVHGLNTMTE